MADDKQDTDVEAWRKAVKEREEKGLPAPPANRFSDFPVGWVPPQAKDPKDGA